MPDTGVEVQTWPDERLSGFDLGDVADGDMFVCEMHDGAVDDVRGRIPSEWHAALLNALLEAEGMEKRWAIEGLPLPREPYRDGSRTSIQSGPFIESQEEAEFAAAQRGGRAVPIYVPKEPTDG